jgi:uncharacterized protein (DUF433 family)
METVMTDWAACDEVERIPGKVSGTWVVKGTRIPVEAVLTNAADQTPEAIAVMFPGLSADVVRRIIAFGSKEPSRVAHSA